MSVLRDVKISIVLELNKKGGTLMQRKLLTICISALVSLAGCGSQNSTCDHCQKLEEVLDYFSEVNANGHLCSQGRVEDWQEFEKVLYASLGCTPPCKSLPNGWKACLTLRQIWPEISSSNVRRIAFFETFGEPDPEKWHVTFEVTEGALGKSVELLAKAVKESEKRGRCWNLGTDIWDIKRMMIATGDGTYVIPYIWDSKKIYGNDWISYDLSDYLRRK